MLKKVIPVILAVIFLIGAESFAVEEKKGKPKGKATQKQMQQRRQRVAKEIEQRLERAEKRVEEIIERAERRAIEIIERAEREAEGIVERTKREAAGRAEIRGGHPRIERDIERQVRRSRNRGEVEIRVEKRGCDRCGDVEVEKHFKAMGPESAHMRAGAGKGCPGRFHKGMGRMGRGMRCQKMGRGMKGRGMRCHQMGRRMKGRGMGGDMQCRGMGRRMRSRRMNKAGADMPPRGMGRGMGQMHQGMGRMRRGMGERRCDDELRYGKGLRGRENPRDDDDDQPRYDDW